jgi:hypothetical protein
VLHRYSRQRVSRPSAGLLKKQAAEPNRHVTNLTPPRDKTTIIAQVTAASLMCHAKQYCNACHQCAGALHNA